jgi:hypothetical protein
MKKTIGILYICTGKYNIFWKDFYESSENYFLKEENYSKEYFVFTDDKNLIYRNKNNVHIIYQKLLSWPYSTLMRFEIFNNSKKLYTDLDYLYFFNANMLFVDEVNRDFLPTKDKKLSFLQHPGFYNKVKKLFTYERNMKSLAGIEKEKGEYYFAGGLNGGEKDTYLEMCSVLEKNIVKDLDNQFIAIWHDESHLNKYAIDHSDIIKVLDPSYGYPEGQRIPFKAKIIIRNKSNYGGHSFLRSRDNYRCIK